MRRPPRSFVAECAPLEPRALLAAGRPAMRANSVQFGPAWGSQLVGPMAPPVHVVGQDDGFVTVVLTRSDNRGVSQVRVVTDPASPAVGGNLPPVDQLVTFPDKATDAVVTVPITAGAANPGEVDVNLSLVPVSPRLRVDAPTPLRILASNEAIVPSIVAVEGKARSIVLRFNKSMDPVAASDVRNYRVTWKAYHNLHNSLGPLAIVNGDWWHDGTQKAGTVPIRSARYDAATHSVTLVARRPFHYDKATGGIAVTQAGSTPWLTDAGGLPIEAVYSPGRFAVNVFPDLHPGR